MDFPNPAIARLVERDPECREAAGFRMGFGPREKVVYDWVVDYAQDRYAEHDRAFSDLDGKAASIIGYLGGGTSLLTLGALTAAATGQVHPWVVVAAVPALLLALAALVFASLARQANWAYAMPTVAVAVDYAHYFDTAGDARAATLGQWHFTTTLMRKAVGRKATRVNVATWLFVGSVVALLLPLGIAVGRRFGEPTPPPPVVIKVEQVPAAN